MHVGEHAPIERHDVAEAGVVGLEAADERRLAALEDPDDAPFEPLLGLPLDARDDAIAVHRLGQVGGRDVDVLLVAASTVLGHDEAEAGRIGREPADDEVHLLGQAEAVAANLQQLAGRRRATSAAA